MACTVAASSGKLQSTPPISACEQRMQLADAQIHHSLTLQPIGVVFGEVCCICKESAAKIPAMVAGWS